MIATPLRSDWHSLSMDEDVTCPISALDLLSYEIHRPAPRDPVSLTVLAIFYVGQKNQGDWWRGTQIQRFALQQVGGSVSHYSMPIF